MLHVVQFQVIELYHLLASLSVKKISRRLNNVPILYCGYECTDHFLLCAQFALGVALRCIRCACGCEFGFYHIVATIIFAQLSFEAWCPPGFGLKQVPSLAYSVFLFSCGILFCT